jgi:S-formylglutathione hydrolase
LDVATIRKCARLTSSAGGLGIPGEDDSWDFGSAAGFYIDATKDPWTKGYNMYTYITDELPKALFSAFDNLDGSRVSITGHSMGGHGALTLVSGKICRSLTAGLDNADL